MKVKVEICRRLSYKGIIEMGEERYKLLKEIGMSGESMNILVSNHSTLSKNQSIEWELIEFEESKDEG